MLLQFIDLMHEYESHPDIRRVLPDMLMCSKNNANQILYMHAVWMDVEGACVDVSVYGSQMKKHSDTLMPTTISSGPRLNQD